MNQDIMSNLNTHLPFLRKAGWFPSLIFLIHCILSLGFKAYDRMPWLDVPMHLLGGVAIAYFFDIVLQHLDRLGRMRIGSRQAALLMILGLTGTATVLWEFAEFLADALFHLGAQRSIANTMKDQFMGLLGGLGYLGLFHRLTPSPAAAPDVGAKSSC